MKNLFIALILILALLVLPGCLPDWAVPGEGEGEPEVPVLEMEANADAGLIKALDEEENLRDAIAWSIENTGELNIFKYELTFDVYYPMENKDNIILQIEGFALGVGEKDEDILMLVAYDTPETVSVTWELFD